MAGFPYTKPRLPLKEIKGNDSVVVLICSLDIFIDKKVSGAGVCLIYPIDTKYSKLIQEENRQNLLAEHPLGNNKTAYA